MMCRECWEPTTRDDDLCTWCSKSPAQQERHMLRTYAIAVVGLVLLVAGLFLAEAGY